MKSYSVSLVVLSLFSLSPLQVFAQNVVMQKAEVDACVGRAVDSAKAIATLNFPAADAAKTVKSATPGKIGANDYAVMISLTSGANDVYEVTTQAKDGVCIVVDVKRITDAE